MSASVLVQDVTQVSEEQDVKCLWIQKEPLDVIAMNNLPFPVWWVC